MATQRFRPDNTEGYDAADLGLLNEAYERLTAHDHLLGFADDIAHQSYLDNLSERLLAAYDAGKRGHELLIV